MTRSRWALAACACAALASVSACERPRQERQQPQPSALPSPAPTISASPSASIIRPDITPHPIDVIPPPPLKLTVGFPDGGSELNAAAKQALMHLLEAEQIDQAWPIVLRGHSDSAGSDRANLAVSQRRAEAVAAWLEDHGVSADRIRIVAFGEQNPVAPNANPNGTPNEPGRAKNRRVDIRIAPPAPAADAEGGARQEDESDGA
jgi:OOP family OmpA-OmpF porin